MVLNKNRLAGTFPLFIVILSFQSGYAGAGIAEGPIGQVKPKEGAACKRLSEVKARPFKEDLMRDEAYQDIMSRGKAAIPCLIREITNITIVKDQGSTPLYTDFRLGDLAFFLLLDITKTPLEQLLPDSVKSRLKEGGVYAYFQYVERPSNRKALQDKWRVWWAKHRN